MATPLAPTDASSSVAPAPSHNSETSGSDLAGWSIYVINLDRSTERLRAISDHFANLHLPFQRVLAVDGRTLEDTELKTQLDHRAFLLKHGKHPAPGEIGCYLSHVRALQTFLHSDARFALILEDDALPPNNLATVLNDLEANAHRWDVVKLSGVHRGTPIKVARISENTHLCVMLTQCTGSSAYAVQRPAAERYLGRLLPMSLPYDHEFDKGWKYGLRIRYITPFPFRHQQDNATTISINPSRKLQGIHRLPKHLYRLGIEIVRLFYNCLDALRSLLIRR